MIFVAIFSQLDEARTSQAGFRAMLYELARSIVQRIFQDKILAGLVIVGILAIFVGGFGGDPADKTASGPREERGKHASASKTKTDADNKADPAPQKAEKKSSPAQAAQDPKLEPNLAIQFVSWWIGSAMDYNPQTAIQNRQQALTWITPEVAASYQAAFWTPETADAICSGRVKGSFTPLSVNAIAANPDGSVVVNVTGQLVFQQGPRPHIQQLSTDYLVKRESGGLRIAGLFNRAATVPGSSVY